MIISRSILSPFITSRRKALLPESKHGFRAIRLQECKHRHRVGRVNAAGKSGFLQHSSEFFGWLSSFGLWWTCIVGVTSFTHFNPEIAYAYAHDDKLAHHALKYPCEDVSQYYSHIGHVEGAALMEQLNLLVSGHQSLSYKQVWDALKILDAADVENPEATPDIIEIYSLRAVPKSLAGKPEGWNREHLWPRSYGLTHLSSTDLHNLHPADVNVNSARGNKYYGECTRKGGSCLKPANREAAPDTEADKDRWAPPLQVRGDIARSLMYMAVRYGLHQPIGSPNLQLSDSPSIGNANMGLLSVLLKWNEEDPPSRSEQLRNDRICGLYQHNRNPFVDHPEYANQIWRSAVQANTVTNSNSSQLKAWINEFHYKNKGKDLNEFVEIIVRSVLDAANLKVVLYNGSTGKMYMSMSLKDRAFSINQNGSKVLIYTGFFSLQNGPADGIALVSIKDGNCEVIQFLSYEGVMKAIDGPARDSESLDIGVRETEDSSDLGSLGLTGNGLKNYQWKKFLTEGSPGRLNPGKNFDGSGWECFEVMKNNRRESPR